MQTMSVGRQGFGGGEGVSGGTGTGGLGSVMARVWVARARQERRRVLRRDFMGLFTESVEMDWKNGDEMRCFAM